MEVPALDNVSRIAFLPPMSGLAAVEPKWEHGRINVLIGEGQTAQVLRNLCYQIFSETIDVWKKIVSKINELFGIILLEPEFVAERGEITMSYKEPNDIELDISSSGRGVQQVLLLLAFLYSNQGTVLLLDEPDAHLEILRQRQIYDLLTNIAEETGSQIIAASHSEVLLNEAADRDIVIAFTGNPHRIDSTAQTIKALREIGFEHYYNAEQTGWVLYLEGSTDLSILKTFAQTLNHSAAEILERPFVHYVGNNPQKARDHYYGLKDAFPLLRGIALFDRLEKTLDKSGMLIEIMWSKREIENYFCTKTVLTEFARKGDPGDDENDLFAEARTKQMEESIQEVEGALNTLEKDPWSDEIKVTDDFLKPVFKAYYAKQNQVNTFYKSNYHVLASLIPMEEIDKEIISALDKIYEIAVGT